MEEKKIITAIDKLDGSLVHVVKEHHHISGDYYSTVDENKPHKCFFPERLDFNLENYKVSIPDLRRVLMLAGMSDAQITEIVENLMKG